MIERSELHRYFMVRQVSTGRDLWVLSTDAFAVTDWDYDRASDGQYFLCESPVTSHPWACPVRLDDAGPVPDGRGRWSPDAWEHIYGCHQCLSTSPHAGYFRERYPAEYAKRLADVKANWAGEDVLA